MILWVTAVAAVLATASPASLQEPLGGPVRLSVPIVRQAPERCGPAALAMVLRFHGAGPNAIQEAEAAYDPVLRGSLITELAAAARRAGFRATVEAPQVHELEALLRERLPPILLYQRGVGPIGRAHYGVVVGWDPIQKRYTLHDGGSRPRAISRDDLLRRWRAGGGQALLVRPSGP